MRTGRPDPEAPADARAPADPEASADPEVVAEVREGLSTRPRTLPSRHFYDRRGSELFEAITRLSEYYLTRTEQALLDGPVGEAVRMRRFASLVEPGAGSARKTRSLLEALTAAGTGRLYLATDVSADFLAETADRVGRAFPDLEVRTEVADMSRELRLPDDLPRPALVALLGSTIGNFDEDEAVALFRRVRRSLRPGDAFLLGADLRPGTGKSVDELEAAYDDPAGVTAEFNRNILRVLNRRAGADFRPAAYAHEARWEGALGRIEMHLRPLRPQRVRLADGSTFDLEPDDTIRTEISCKYERPLLERMLERAGLRTAEWVADARDRYAVLLAEPLRAPEPSAPSSEG